MSDEPDYLHPYRDAVERHGPGFEATLWGSEHTQRLRFEVMLEAVDLRHTTVLDVGCGRGDFAAHLLEHAVEYDRFIGVDAMEPMIEAAAARGLARAAFHVVDPIRDPEVLGRWSPDVICFSGTLNTMDEDTARRLVGAAFVAANHAVAFNFLSDRMHPRWAERDLHPARRFDTEAWLGWAFRQTSRVLFNQAYLDGHDATIVLWRDDV